MSINQAYSKCPKCETNYSYLDFTIENKSGVEIWSDGFYMAPMKRDVLSFAKCPSCNTFFWLKKKAIQEPPDSAIVKKIGNFWFLNNIGRNEIDHIKDALKSGLANSANKEIYLRTKLWHVINHVMRKYDSQGFFSKIKHQVFESAEYKNSLKLYNYEVSLKLSNLIRLMNLLKRDKKENTNNLLFAELYREIGDFGKAMVFAHKAKTASKIDLDRMTLLEKNIASKNKMAYRL